ncbi:MAG: aconitase X catalytic domain-containing protein [Candidatus Altiarchaeota archaeon]|nr:aconitase X catalytic domain-containing protein [Candidatus Altiarchaeota archaeon]
MHLTKDEEKILNGEEGNAAQKSMQILVALGDIFGADSLIPIKSVQVAGVSYHNLGEAGLEFLAELARDGRVKVPTTLNPAGMDLRNWEKLGIPKDFAIKQKLVIDAFARMGITTTCTCTPYLIGYSPRFGDHVAWAESSAVTYCNSVIGARTNREGGPSALAAAFVGKTPNYGLHLSENRAPTIKVDVKARLKTLPDFGALGYVIGKRAQNQIPYITGISEAPNDFLKSFSASVVTYGAQPMFHMEKITPEYKAYEVPKETIVVKDEDIGNAYKAINDDFNDIEFVCLGCPHCSLDEIQEIAYLLKDKKIASNVEFWVCCARPMMEKAKKSGFVKTIEKAGGKFACDTCMAVAPLKGRFKSVATTSAKGCYYSRGHNAMATKIGSIQQCVEAGIRGKWS